MSGGNAAQFPGLDLKAWAHITPSTGAILKSNGFSGVVRNAAGDWSFTFTAAQPNANYLVDSKVNQIQNQGHVTQKITAKLTTSFKVQNSIFIQGVGETLDDGSSVFVAVYA